MSEVEKLVERLTDQANYLHSRGARENDEEALRAAASALQSQSRRVEELEGALRAAKSEIAALKEAAYGED